MKNMKTKQLLSSLLLAGTIAGLVPGCASHQETQAKLQAQAKISRVDAEKTALTKAPGGTIQEGELEMEHGKLVWSFDIATPGSKDITEVHVDALTGAVLSVEKETPADQEKEKKADAKKTK